MFLVSGITGKVGSAVARTLLARGRAVRALVRDPAKAAAWADKGVELRQGDLTDATALAAAMESVAGVFLMQPTPPAVSDDFPEARAIIAGIREALHRGLPPLLAVLSSIGSEQPSGLGNITQTHLLEAALKDIATPIAIVRAGAFIDNAVPGLDRAAQTGVFDTFLQPTDRAVPMVASADIGREIATLLADGWTGRKLVELGSPISPDDLADAMSQALGRPVKARAIPREQWTSRLTAIGMAPAKTTSFEAMQDGFNSGWIHFGVPGAESISATTSPADVFRAGAAPSR